MPQINIDTNYSLPAGNTVNVAAGSDLQLALDDAEPGDIILLEAGATFTGNFNLPYKNNPLKKWIYIQSSDYNNLPAPGERVSPNDAGSMPKIRATNGDRPITTENKANYLRFVGIEFYSNASLSGAMIKLGQADLTNAADQPNNIIIDRCYIHGSDSVQIRRAVEFQGAYMSVIGSYIDNIKHGSEPQAIAGWNGPGPYKIENNFLEASGENILFGGAKISLASNIPSDIVIRENHFYKRLSWRGDNSITVKNHLEFKNGQRILVDRNVFENCWGAQQRGHSFVLTPRSQAGDHTWVVVKDVTFTNNIIKNVALGITIGNGDYPAYLPEPTHKLKIENNLFFNVSRYYGYDTSNGEAWAFLFGLGVHDISIIHNTLIHERDLGYFSNASQEKSKIMLKDNIFSNGINGDGCAGGDSCFSKHMPDIIVNFNIFTGQDAANYSTGSNNLFPSSLSEIRFSDPGNHNYSLSPTSPYKNSASDGNDIGVDMAKLRGYSLSPPQKLRIISTQ